MLILMEVASCPGNCNHVRKLFRRAGLYLKYPLTRNHCENNSVRYIFRNVRGSLRQDLPPPLGETEIQTMVLDLFSKVFPIKEGDWTSLGFWSERWGSQKLG